MTDLTRPSAASKPCGASRPSARVRRRNALQPPRQPGWSDCRLSGAYAAPPLQVAPPSSWPSAVPLSGSTSLICGRPISAITQVSLLARRVRSTARFDQVIPGQSAPSLPRALPAAGGINCRGCRCCRRGQPQGAGCYALAHIFERHCCRVSRHAFSAALLTGKANGSGSKCGLAERNVRSKCTVCALGCLRPKSAHSSKMTPTLGAG